MLSPFSQLAWRLWGVLGPLQIIAILVLIALIIFWVQYRKRQM